MVAKNTKNYKKYKNLTKQTKKVHVTFSTTFSYRFPNKTLGKAHNQTWFDNNDYVYIYLPGKIR